MLTAVLKKNYKMSYLYKVIFIPQVFKSDKHTVHTDTVEQISAFFIEIRYIRFAHERMSSDVWFSHLVPECF